MSFQPFLANEPVSIHCGNLPHWRQCGATYFVTARLADSVPESKVAEWKQKRQAWLRMHKLSAVDYLHALPENLRHEYHREFTERFHQLLDAGYGDCVFARGDCAAVLIAKLLSGSSFSYDLDAWAIMPNHMHALVSPKAGVSLGEIIQQWKGGSAREINILLGKSGQLWQREPFDHIVRSEAQLNHFRSYIALNPEKARLRNGFVMGVGQKAGLSADLLLQTFGLDRGSK